MATMDGRAVPKIRTGMNFGTWYRFLIRDLLVRNVVRIVSPDFFGPVCGTENFSISHRRFWIGPQFYNNFEFRTPDRTELRRFGTVQNFIRIFTNVQKTGTTGQIKSPTKNTYHGSYRTNPYRRSGRPWLVTLWSQNFVFANYRKFVEQSIIGGISLIFCG